MNRAKKVNAKDNEYPVERFYRDARLLRLYEGTTQVQQLIIGKELLRAD